MKSLKHIAIMLVAVVTVSSCDYFYSLDLENQYSEGIYIWSQKTGLKTGNDPQTIDELNDKWYLHYIEPGQMGSFADVMTGRPVDAQWVVEDVFWKTDILMIAIFDAKRLDENWGIGKMSDYVIQKYWLRKEDVVEEDGKTYKKISFPPNEGMKDVEMEPAYGTYN